MKKNSLLVFIMAFSISISSTNAFASSNTSISVEDVIAVQDEEIKVPIKISNNQGICGATISVSYNENLVLKDISKGEALKDLTMTKPGDLTANPFNIVFDGVEEDASDGVMAYLYFESLSDVGTYDISVTYADGDIVNGDLEPLEVEMINGKVKIVSDSGGNEGEEGDNEDDEKYDGPIITIGEVAADPGENVDVPVHIAGNTGICGATLKFTYDDSLLLTNITKGAALEDLTMTKPGNLTANPFNIVFDNIEEDNTNGLFLTLTFTAPQEDGIYDITASYEDGDIINGDLMPVNVLIKNGSIAVGNKNIAVSIDGEIINLPSIGETNGSIFIAFYNDLDVMTSVKMYEISSSQISVTADLNASYAKVFCWSDDLKSLCAAQEIILK